MERIDNNIRFEFAQGQIKRLAGLEDYPRWVPEAVNELAVIAVKWALSKWHLERTIDEIRDDWLKCPKPTELRGMLQRDREEVVNLNCSDCAGSGWRIVDKDGTSGAERCHCGSVPPAPGIAPLGKSRQPSRGLLRVAKIQFLLPPADSAEQAEWDKVQEALRRMRGEIKAPPAEEQELPTAAVSEQQIRNPTADEIDQLRAIAVEVNRLRAIELARRRRRDEELEEPHDHHDGQAVLLGDLEGV